MSNYDPIARTRTLARIVGPYLLIVGVVMFVRYDTLPVLFSAFMDDSPLVLATGAFTLMAGLVIVAAHHHWKGAAAIAISLIGVVASLKGVSLMIAPNLGAEMTTTLVQAPLVLMISAGAEVTIGIWLSVVGWAAR